MVNRVTITFEQREYSALLEMAGIEMRDPAHQVRYLVRTELEKQGLLEREKREIAQKERCQQEAA